MELVVFVASLKFFFVEGGEQFIVGAETAKKIGLEATLKITIAGVSFAVILFFLLFYSHALIPTRWLELALAVTLYFFAATMFKVIEKGGGETRFRQRGSQVWIHHDRKLRISGKCNCVGCVNLY